MLYNVVTLRDTIPTNKGDRTMPTKLSKETVAKIQEMLRNKSESGMTNRDIAKACGTSHATIDNYAARIKKERESVVICPRCKRKVEKQFSFCP